MKAQFRVKEKLSDFFYDIEKHPDRKSLVILFLISFAYGLLHALGPGHRKTVLFSIFLSRKSRVYEPFAAGFFGALLHAISSIILVFSLYLITDTIAHLSKTDNAYAAIKGITFLLLFIFSMILIIKQIMPGHSHEKKFYGKKLLVFLILTNSVPCPGATMILLMGLYLEITFYAVLSVGFMSMGMAVIMIMVSYLAYLGRTGLLKSLDTDSRRNRMIRTMAEIIELGSYGFILLFSLYMAYPFIRSAGKLLLLKIL